MDLARYGYDQDVQDSFAKRAGETGSNAVTGALSPLPPGTLVQFPALGSAERARLRTAGLELIRAGKVGAVILAGGMATRFGGVVKAVVPALGDDSFLEVKQADIHALGGVPTLVMSSFATHDAILAHISDARIPGRFDVFPQFVALRLTPDGGLFLD